MTRICIASSGLGHVARGIEAWADDLGQALVERGEQIVLCKGGGTPRGNHERVVPCWTRESRMAKSLLRVMPTSLGWRIGLGSGYTIEQSTFARNLIKLLRAEQVDVLHVQDPLVALRVQQAHERGILPTRTILAHGTEEPLQFQSRITFLQHLAPWHLEEARAHGVFKNSWTALPNFIDTEHFRPGSDDALRHELGIPGDAVVILAAAAIKRHHKRIDYLLNEFHALTELATELPLWLVVAGGWERDTDQLIAAGKQLLGDHVRFLVRFPRPRMAELYRAADVFTLASLKEMMPIALLEATASGLPCVVHEHPVMQWMIGPGGRSADLSQPGGWAHAMSRLLRDRQLSLELGRQARQHCLQHFSRDAVVDRIVAYYDFVIRYPDSGAGDRTAPSEVAA